MTHKEKLREYVHFKKISNRKFCLRINVSDKFLATDGAIYSKILPKIRKSFPDLNMDWLLFDKGDMIIESKTDILMSDMSHAGRMQTIIDYSKMSRRAFGIKLGYNDGSAFYNLLNGRNGISAKLANSIVEVYPEINYKWILAGEGEMIIEPKEDETSLEKRLDRLEKSLQNTNDTLELKIENLKLKIENIQLKSAK